MKPTVPLVLPAVALAVVASTLIGPAPAAEPPADRVVAMYFHRTERCPTCRKMGSYSEEAVKTGFPEQLENGTVAFYYVDFQDKKNAALAKGYNISGPALIVANIKGNKVTEYKNLEDIWANVGDKDASIAYVQRNIAAYCQ
jgi:hypothetical protein